MTESGGAIINISSIEGLVGNQFVPAYNASKGGVRFWASISTGLKTGIGREAAIAPLL